MRSYEGEATWRQIQAYLPEENQITPGCAPAEDYLDLGFAQVHVDVYRAAQPTGVVVLFHGVGGNGRLLEFIALPLWRAGYDVVCPDLPLYGLTSYQGVVTYPQWIACGREICARYEHPDLPLVVFGLSAGGMLAYQVACELPRVDGLIATCLLDQRIPRVTRETASSGAMAVLGKPFLRAVHRPFAGLTLPMKAVCNMKAIVNNESLAELLMSDPLSSGARVSLEFLYGMLNPDIRVEPEAFTACPVLLAHPADDHWTNPLLSRLFFDRIAAPKTFRLIEGAGHFPIEPAGLRELERCCGSFLAALGRGQG